MTPLRAIVVRLMGGLGNQMFQFATGYALAERSGAPLLVDRTFLDERPMHMTWTARELEIDAFNIPLNFASREQVQDLRKLRRPITFRRQSWFREHDKRYDPQLAQQKAPVLLEGFWQSERYFEQVAGELRTVLFQPTDTPAEVNSALAQQARSTNSASVHVRLGDYLSNPESAAFHGQLSARYYAAAANELATNHGVEHFFVFSDEPQKVSDLIHLPGSVTYVTHNTGRYSHWDIWLMRQCDHHIIANSSFSWWGAWLNPSPNKVVIAPKDWFAGGRVPNDIVPPTWLRR